MKFPTYEEMAKDVAQKAMDDFLFNGKSIREWAKLIIDLGIPQNPTNGDVIKAMFPNLTAKVIDTDEYTNKPKTVEISVEKGMHILTTISAEVWNAPWKGQKE